MGGIDNYCTQADDASWYKQGLGWMRQGTLERAGEEIEAKADHDDGENKKDDVEDEKDDANRVEAVKSKRDWRAISTASE